MDQTQDDDTNPATRRSKQMERSCIICHQRKLRCDKGFPCARCTKSGVLCHYPDKEEPVPRRARTTLATLAERLALLERTIIAISNDPVEVVGQARRQRHQLHLPLPKSSEESQANEENQKNTSDLMTLGEGKAPEYSETLIQNDSASYYINDFLFSRILEEEQDLRSVMMALSDDVSTSKTSRSPGLLDIFLGGSVDTFSAEQQHTHLSCKQASELFQNFTRIVDPMDKLLHIPTIEAVFFTAIRDMEHTPADIRGLLFAIYIASTTSMLPDDAKSLLGKTKQDALAEFRHGLSLALSEAGLPQKATLTSLQAVAIFLGISRAHNAGRELWILYGLAIRMAQSLGMHRDSSNFQDITPFEGEMRRRLWWYLITHESRAAEDCGLAVFTPTSPGQVRFPLNVDDAMLWPGMKNLPEERGNGSWTEMTKSLILIRTMQTRRHLYSFLSGSSEDDVHGSNTSTAGMDENRRRDIVHGHIAQMEKILEKCNGAVPIQNATIIVSRILLRKLDFVSRIQWSHRLPAPFSSDNNGPRTLPNTSDENIVDACEILELELSMQSDILLVKYCWASETYTQFHVLQFILWYLKTKPSSQHANRAWALVDAAFEKERSRVRRQDLPASQNRGMDRWDIIWKLRDQALLAARTSTSCSTSGECGRGLGGEIRQDTTVSETGALDVMHDDSDVHTEAACYNDDVLDWNMLLDPLTVESFIFK